MKYSESSHIKLNLKKPEDITIPPRENGPIKGLHLYREGWECLQCEYVCGSNAPMKNNHCRPKYGWTDGKPSVWKKQPIQAEFIFITLINV